VTYPDLNYASHCRRATMPALAGPLPDPAQIRPLFNDRLKWPARRRAAFLSDFAPKITTRIKLFSPLQGKDNAFTRRSSARKHT